MSNTQSDFPALRATGVTKSYGSKKVLQDVTLQVNHGTIFGLLGPNGAGKTTFIKAVLNLTKMDAGQILIKGINAKDEHSRQNVAYLPEKFFFYPYYNVHNTLLFFAKMYGIPSHQVHQKMEEALTKLNLIPLQKQKLKTLSKGQLQRVGLSKVIMSDADLLILDEPFSGLDPIGIKELKDLLKELRQSGKTIFLNTHILSEVEQICDEVAILREGTILTQGRVQDILKSSKLEDYLYHQIKGQNP